MRKFDLSLRSSRSSYFATFRSEERFSRNAETDLVCRLLLENKNVHKKSDWRAESSRRDCAGAHETGGRGFTRQPRVHCVDHTGFGSFFFNETTTTEIYTLSLHDALPI